jgi:hypothetical protein
MSLINDALKRASNNKRRESGDGPSLQPTFEDRHSRLAASLIPVLLIIIVIAAAGYGGWSWYSKRKASETAAGDKTNSVARIPATAAAPATNNPIARAQATLAKVTARNNVEETNAIPAFPGAAKNGVNGSKSNGVTVGAKTAPTANGTVTIPGVAPSPEPRLQAIYYRLKDPSVLINGRTVKQGQEVDGMRIVKIERNAVTVEQNGKTRVLTLK